MGIKRMVRVNQLIKQEVAQSLFRVVNDQGFDLSAITVTRVETSSDLRHARVGISIRGSPARQKEMLHQLRGHRKEIQEALNKDVIMKYTPQLSFELDASIAEGDRVLHVIAEMEATHPEWDDKPPATEEGDE